MSDDDDDEYKGVDESFYTFAPVPDFDLDDIAGSTGVSLGQGSTEGGGLEETIKKWDGEGRGKQAHRDLNEKRDQREKVVSQNSRKDRERPSSRDGRPFFPFMLHPNIFINL